MIGRHAAIALMLGASAMATASVAARPPEPRRQPDPPYEDDEAIRYAQERYEAYEARVAEQRAAAREREAERAARRRAEDQPIIDAAAAKRARKNAQRLKAARAPTAGDATNGQ